MAKYEFVGRNTLRVSTDSHKYILLKDLDPTIEGDQKEINLIIESKDQRGSLTRTGIRVKLSKLKTCLKRLEKGE